MKIIRLHTLSARTPSMQDAYKVIELMHLCDKYAPLLGHHHEDDIKLVWQQAGFHLMLDAWVIVTRDDQLVGYADIQQSCEQANANFALALYIHPDYQSRGIETLLIRLGEERMYQISRSGAAYHAIKGSISVNRSNHILCEAIQHEGYSLGQQFLRMHIALEQMNHQPSDTVGELMTIDVPLTSARESNTLSYSERVTSYSAMLYDVYEKMLKYDVVDKKTSEAMPVLQETSV